MPVLDYFLKHQQALEFAVQHSSSDNLDQMADVIWANQGKLFFTGVGKNGHVAAKAASTFCSIGYAAHYINPVDAMHGDLGALVGGDLILAVSKSAQTAELIDFLQQAYRKRAIIMCLHANEHFDLPWVQHQLYVPMTEECDDLNIVPTASIVVFTALLQSVACELARRSSLTKPQFVFNHPGGSIGKSHDHSQ
jgi:arabinose-5-phosphate isomerase